MAKSTQSGERRIREHLERSLPEMREGERKNVEAALLRAADRYDRYAKLREEWRHYSKRKNRIEIINILALAAMKRLHELDIISRDDLEVRLGRERWTAIVDGLGTLVDATERTASGIQTRGKPRDLAEERWIWEVADIFENVYRREAKVWGSGSGREKRRGPFYKLLEVSRSSSFPLYGKLHTKQVHATLERRRNRKSRRKKL